MAGRQARSKRTADDDGLPMPYEGARQLYPTEWREYRERQAQHHERFPDYISGWHRPTVPTAEKVWALVSAARPDLRVSAFLPGHEWLTPGEIDAIAAQAKQAFVVALDAAILVGERGAMLTTNHVFDALAAHWSDNYRACVEAERAFVSWQMTAKTVRASWRDLLRNGVRLDVPWHTVRDGVPGLYATKRIAERGHQVTLDADRRLLNRFIEIIEADPVYRRHQSAHLRLLLASEGLPAPRTAREIAGEWAYNVAEVGPRSEELIRRLEAARLYLHVPTFLADLAQMETRLAELEARVPDDATIREYTSLYGHFLQYKGVRKQVEASTPDADECVEIRSGFYKGMNRRYNATHFWPTEVTSKPASEQSERISALDEPGKSAIYVKTTQRGRWFQAASKFDRPGWEWEGWETWSDEWAGDRRPLVGVDVSASQFQILAVFCGLTEFEQELAAPNPSLKVTLATQAYHRSRDPHDDFWLPDGFNNNDEKLDEKLLAAVKMAPRNLVYGSKLPKIARDLQNEPEEYGPGLGDAQNIRRLLSPTRVMELLSTYLPACKAAAQAAFDRNKYAGFVFTDPFDGARVRWNPIRLWKCPIGGSGPKVYVHVPAGKPNRRGDYPVALQAKPGEQALQREIAPCLAHTLDALFAGLVVEKLNALGVRDIVSLHDSWAVASDALPALYEAVETAGEPWLRALGPVYAALEHYLPPRTQYGNLVRHWREQWDRRKAAGNWPRFRVDDAKLTTLELGAKTPF